MNSNERMIIAKGKPVSADVLSCQFNYSSRMWDITYKNGKSFHYNAQSIIILDKPVCVDPKAYQIRHNGKSLDNISSILAYKDAEKEYWHICFWNGYEHEYCKDELELNKSVFNYQNARQVFEYLRAVAGYVSVRTEDGTEILSKQYEKISFLSDDTAAAVYLNPEQYKPETGLDSEAPLFPFGCNDSQFKAVHNALSNKISIIEGPPGTGKTQTILNIIANLVLQGKTVQVVSNNNSAIDNIIEKMASEKYGVAFIAAQLGREQRRKTFIASQSGRYPDLSAWNTDHSDSEAFLKSMQEKSLKLQEVFKDKSHLAQLRHELYVIQLERTHHQSVVSIEERLAIRKKLPAAKLMEFWQEYQDIQEGNKRAGLFYRILRYFTHGINVGETLAHDSGTVISSLQNQYYETRENEIQEEISALERKLSTIDADKMIAEFTSMSLTCFQGRLAKRFPHKGKRNIFTADELWKNPEEFLKEYPVVLSTTYTARSSLGKNARFDYVIMDEASQIDVATGLLALSSAKNAVIVGDTKQLPNVITAQQKEELNRISQRYRIPPAYDFSEHSFLESVCELMKESIPQVTLREHYRCHPQIIEFCNQKFYDGNLIVMTDQNDTSALRLVTTVAGNHKRDRMNQRQIDVIRTEVLPALHCPKSQIGIIAPYRNQVRQLIQELAEPEIDIATVHRFQGREKDVIILSTVDDTVTEFSDDPNLLNVAVSRAKKQFIIVAADQEQPAGSNVGDLIGYIRYNNCDVIHSEISSVFDYLYDQYSESRRQYLKKYGRISEYDSENLVYGLIQDEMKKRGDLPLGLLCHHPLQLLIQDQTKMSLEEKAFVNTGLSHLDFLIFNKVSKKPILAIEVDGFHYHKAGTRQAERDKLKNHIMEVYGIPLIRFTTNGSGEKEKLRLELDRIFQGN